MKSSTKFSVGFSEFLKLLTRYGQNDSVQHPSQVSMATGSGPPWVSRNTVGGMAHRWWIPSVTEKIKSLFLRNQKEPGRRCWWCKTPLKTLIAFVHSYPGSITKRAVSKIPRVSPLPSSYSASTYFVAIYEISATKGVADGLIVNWFMILIAPEK